jgi:hypothetical protein
LQPPPPCPSAPRRRSPEHRRTTAHRSFPPCLRHRPALRPLLSRARPVSSTEPTQPPLSTPPPPRRRHRREALLRLPETFFDLRPVSAIVLILDLRPSRVALTLGFAPPCHVRSSSNRPSRDVFAPRLFRTSLIFVLGFVEILFFVSPNRLMFRRISARPVRREVSRPKSPFSRRSEVAIEFRFTSYLICLLPLGFRTFRSYMLLIVDPSIPSFQRVCRCVGVTAVLLIGSEAKPADTD